jgi:importin subunit beta-1
MRSSEEQVALQAVEFWSTVCEEEIEIRFEIEEAAENQEEASVTCFNFAKGAVNDIAPVLLWLLTQQVIFCNCKSAFTNCYIGRRR